MRDPALGSYCARLERTGPRSVAGYCYDADRLSARLVVELRIDGVGAAWALADGFVDSLSEAGIGDGRYGFSFTLAPETVLGGGYAQILVANTEVIPAPPLTLAPAADRVRAEGAGRVRWAGGRHLSGWLTGDPNSASAEVRVTLDGQLIARAPADRWHHLEEVGGARPVPGFDLHLPAAVADGTVKRVVVTDGTGRPLRGSPLTIVAFPDPLTTAVETLYGPEVGPTRARADLFDALLPNSWPLSDLDGWLKHHPVPASAATQPATAVAIIGDGVDAVERTLASLDAQPGLPWVAAALPSSDRIGFQAADLDVFLAGEAQGCAAVLAIPAGATFLPGAAARLAASLADSSAAALVYGDISLGEGPAEVPLAFPSFDYERWLEQGYGALAFGLPIAAALAAARSGADSLFRLANAPLDRTMGRRDAVLHVPGIAARIPPLDIEAAATHLASATRRHLNARGMMATVTAGRGSILPTARVSRPPAPGRVSIVIPTRDRADLLTRCLASIRPARESHGCELLVVDNGSSDPATHTLLATVRADGGRVLPHPGPFNYARLCNHAVEAAEGDLVLFLNNDVEMRGGDWLAELLGRLHEPTTEAVGAVLRWPSGVIQHGGIVLGPGFSASHAFDDRFHGDFGYGDLLRVASEPSAVTGACLLVRRASYRAVGGMDAEHFPVNFNDVDLCLKLAARGGRIVLTPHLDAVHVGSASRGSDRRPDQRHRYERELAGLRARWDDVLQADPAYSPFLALSDNPYAALASPPRSTATRLRHIGAGRHIPSGL